MGRMRDEAYAESYEEGRAEEKRDIVIRMFEKGLTIEDISSYSDQKEEVIRNWLEKAGKL